jgi:hypothetical protein
MASAQFRTRKKLLDHKIRGLRLLARALGLKIAGGPVEADELYELALGNTPKLPKEVSENQMARETSVRLTTGSTLGINRKIRSNATG